MRQKSTFPSSQLREVFKDPAKGEREGQRGWERKSVFVYVCVCVCVCEREREREREIRATEKEGGEINRDGDKEKSKEARRIRD